MKNSKEIQINIFANVLDFSYRIHLISMHINGVSPKQFEDTNGNLWYPNEIFNFEIQS